MKVIHINYQGNNGGAGRAVNRLHCSLLEIGVVSEIWIEDVGANDKDVFGPTGKYQKTITFIRSRVNRMYRNFFISNNLTVHSPAVFPSRLVKMINNSDADIINLHWIGAEMLSIKDLAKIKKPLVWTLHDMWGFCGAEHVSYDNRWIDGYSRSNRPNSESGLDINLWTWKRKLKHWKAPINIIAPSSWLQNCVKKSKVMSGWPVTKIPNPLGKNWKNIDEKFARSVLDLPADEVLIGFGGGNAYHKGLDLLIESLQIFSKKSERKVTLVFFGKVSIDDSKVKDFDITYAGALSDEPSLILMYNSLDALAVPSRIDNLPNTAVESISCGTPVVGFNIGGLPDIVDHHDSGYLASAFSIEDFAEGLSWVISQDKEVIRRKNISKFLACFSAKKVSYQYVSLYTKIINKYLTR